MILTAARILGLGERSPRSRWTMGIVASAAGALILGGTNNVRGLADVEKSVAVAGGKGVLEEVYPLKEECHGGYRSRVEGAKAGINHKFKIFGATIPTSASASETFNGRVTNDVCNTGIAGKQRINTKTGHVTVTIPPEAFVTKVYQTDPTDPNAFTSDNGLEMALRKNLANLVKTLPGGLDVKGPDQTASWLRGLAVLGAFETASKACGEKAWQFMRDNYADSIADDIVADANRYRPDRPIDRQDVTVHLPETIRFEHQYGDQLRRTEEQLAGKGVTITRVDPASLQCESSGNLMVQG